MKITTNAGALFKSARAMVLPLVSGSRKSGAGVPSGSMVEGVKDIMKIGFGNQPLVTLRIMQSRGKRHLIAASFNRHWLPCRVKCGSCMVHGGNIWDENRAASATTIRPGL